MDPGYLMFIPESIRDNRYMILQLLNVTCGREDLSLHSEVGQKDEGYLLMVRCGGGIDHNPECPLWFGQSVRVEPTAETAIALSYIEVSVKFVTETSLFLQILMRSEKLICSS